MKGARGQFGTSLPAPATRYIFTESVGSGRSLRSAQRSLVKLCGYTSSAKSLEHEITIGKAQDFSMADDIIAVHTAVEVRHIGANAVLSD